MRLTRFLTITPSMLSAMATLLLSVAVLLTPQVGFADDPVDPGDPGDEKNCSTDPASPYYCFRPCVGCGGAASCGTNTPPNCTTSNPSQCTDVLPNCNSCACTNPVRGAITCSCQ